VKIIAGLKNNEVIGHGKGRFFEAKSSRFKKNVLLKKKSMNLWVD
jgi:hypothetical protein